jgi:hypothetical protein
MSNEFSYDAVVSHLGSQSDAIGRLAQDSGAFAAAVAAFESKDPDAFRWVLNHQEMLPYCELICYWVRVKMCVLRCFEVCGLPREKVKAVDLQQFASAIVQLASNETLLRRVVDAVSCGDGDDYRAAINELKLNDYCHLLCHWVCAIIYRRVCERICTPIREPLADAASEIRAASNVFAKLVDNKKAIQDISKAAVALDCDSLRETIAVAGFAPWCELICCWICVWWCAYACREVCGVPNPARIEPDEIEEARNFALASRKIASQPRALGDLVQAVHNRDTKAYGEIVARYGLGPYCYQLCAWVCSGICYEFCICVCPPSAPKPIFTSVGSFGIYSDIDGTSGKTNTGAYGFGGPNYAFFGDLQLGGFCPIDSPDFSGVQMKYRFLYATALTTLPGAITAGQLSITVAAGAVTPVPPFDAVICGIPGDPVEVIQVNAVAATTWTVVRGQGGTTAAAAPLGATLAINPAPITNNLVSDHAPRVSVCSRNIPWAQYIPGFPPTAGPTSAATPQAQEVIINQPPAPPDPPNLVVGTPWIGPSAHYTAPDPDGWITVDPGSVTGGFRPLLVFDSAQAVPGGIPLPFGDLGRGSSLPGCVPAGSPVPVSSQKAGTDVAIIFQATRVTVATIDFSNALAKIRVNNWVEVSELDFAEFSTGCCTPIDKTLHVLFTVDHEEMNAGTWSLAITSCCAGSAPGTITPPYPPAPLPAGYTVTFTAGDRGASGTILEDTTNWGNCSYRADLYTTPKLTTGLIDRGTNDNELTFAICNHTPC